MIENKILKLLQKTITTLMCFWMLTTQLPVNVVFADEINTEENIVEDINEYEINNVDNEEEDQIIIEEDVETINKEDDEFIDSEIIEEVETETSINQELIDNINNLLNTDIVNITNVDELTNVYDDINDVIDEYNELSSDEQINIDYDSLLSFKYDVTKLLIDRLVDSLPSEDEINTFDDVQKQIAPTRKLVRSTIPNLISELNEEDQTNYNNQYSSLLSDITTWLADRQKAIMNGGVVGTNVTDSAFYNNYYLLDYIQCDSSHKWAIRVEKNRDENNWMTVYDHYIEYTFSTVGTDEGNLLWFVNPGKSNVFCLYYNGAGNLTWYYHLYNNYDNKKCSVTANTKHTVIIKPNHFYLDGTDNSFTSKGNYAIKRVAISNELAPQKVYGLHIKGVNGTEWCNLVPVLRKSDSHTGLYDLVDNIFYETKVNSDSTTYSAAAYGTKSYTVTLNKQSGTDGTSSVTATVGSAMPKITPPTRAGYTFGGYYTGTGGTGTQYYNADGTSANNWNIPQATTLYAKWTANTNTKYVVNHYKQNADGTYPTTPTETENKTGTTGASVFPPVKSYTGYTSPSSLQQITISGDGKASANYYYTRKIYSITYTLDGGSVSTENKTSYDVETATFTLNNPTKSGYTFIGWTGSNGTTPQTIVTIAKGSTGNRSYTANWSKKTSTIILDGNGATSTGHTTSTTATYGSAMPYITLPTRTGYKLLGYFDAQEGGTKYYNSDNSNQSARNWDKEDASVTLYAQWEPNTYKITLDRGGATSGSTSVTATYNSVLPKISNLPSKVGYTFDGYYTGSNGTGTKYYDENGTSSRIWTGTSDLTLYAKWILSSYKITFNKNGGNGGTDEIGITYNETMPSISVPTKDGYTFDGYYDGESTETKYYNADGSPAVAKWNKGKSATLYAHWTKSVYTITYTLNGGTVVTTNPSSYSVDTETFTLNNPTKTGYTFAGWTGTGLSSASTSVSITKGSTGNRSYTATWIANTNTAYKVEHYQQNTDASTYPSIPTETENKTGTSGANVTPEVKSYIGFTSPSAQTVTIAGNGSTVVKYYYTRNKYKVTLDFNGGNSSQKELTAIYGAPIRVDIKPDRTGYYFNGYYDAKDGGIEYINSDTTSAHVWDKTSDATLYAHWRASQSTIYFDNQGGIGTTPSITATYDVNLESISSNNLPTKEGYTFEGYFDAISDGKQYYSSTGASLEAWDKIGTQATLYAHWSAKTSTITFDKQYGTGGTDSTTVTYGSSMPSITLPTRSGYYFGGYYTSTNGSGIQYYSANGSSTKDWDRIINTTLYAYWKEIIPIPTPNYGLYYNTKMQAGVQPSPYYKVENGGALNAGTYTAIVTPNNGYVWPDGTTDSINISYTINKKDIVGSTIELSEYDDYAGNPVEPKVISVITIPEKIRLSSSDYTVSYLDNTMSDGNNSTKFAYVVITANENSNFTGTAQKQFTINKKKCKVSFVTNGGTDLEDLEVYYGTVLSPSSFTKPTKDGYDFNWWYTDESLKTELDSIYVIKDDMILYAKYDLVNYKINYDLNGGSVSTANPSSYNIETTTFTLNNPTKEGYLFTGWTGTSLSTLTTDVEILTGSTGNREYIAYYDKKINVPLAKENLICDDTEQIGVEEGEGYTLTGHKATNAGTYTAIATLDTGYVWSDGTYGNKEIEFTIKDNRFEVSFNVLGSGTTGLPEGSIVESIEPKTVRLGETYGSMVKPTYVGYTFVGWFLDNVEITEESIVELTDNVTLVAHWNKIDALVKIASENRLSNAIEHDGTYSYFDTLINAINSASENDELIIVKDFKNSFDSTRVNKSLTINIDNYTFNYYNINIDSGKTLTLTGNGGTLGGKVASSNSNTNIIIDGDLTVLAIIDTSGSVQLINGTVSGELSVGASGSVNMTGGIFLTTNTYVYGETTITGGSFSESSKSFATWNNRMDKNKYKLVYNEETNLYDVTELEDVVSIRDKKYKTLEAALADAEDGDELIVLKDIIDENSSNITIDDDITINLNGHSIRNLYYFTYNVKGDLTINGEGEIYSDSTSTSININSGDVTFNDVTTNIRINVGNTSSSCTFNANNINETNRIDVKGSSEVNVDGGYINHLNSVNGSDSNIKVNIYDNPVIDELYFYNPSIENINITSGDYGHPNVKNWVKGLYHVYDENNRYYVREYYEVTLNNIKYGTFLEAYNAAQDGDTIRIEKDLDFARQLEDASIANPVNKRLALNKAITINTNGHRMSYDHTSDYYRVIRILDDVEFTGDGFVDANFQIDKGGTLTITGGTFEKTIAKHGGDLVLINGIFYRNGEVNPDDVYGVYEPTIKYDTIGEYKQVMSECVAKDVSHIRQVADSGEGYLIVEPHHFVNHYCDTIIDGKECGAIDHDSVVAEVFNSNGVLVGQYFALKDAVTAAKTGETVKLLRDLTLTKDTKINESFADGVIIDLNDKSLSIEAESGSQFEGLTNKFIVKNGNIINNNTTGYAAFFNCADVTTYNINFTAPNIDGLGEYAQITACGTKIHLYGGSVGNNVVINHDGSDVITIDNNGNNKFKYKETQLSINTNDNITINGGLFNTIIDQNKYLDNEHIVINSIEQGYQYEVVEGGKITYETNGGSLENPMPTQYTSANGIELPTPTKDNYVFDGWYTDSDLSTKVTNTTSFGKGEKGPKTLYAKWLEPVASVNSNNVITLYASLQEAFDAADSGDTVTLLKYVELAGTETNPKEIPAGVTLTFACNENGCAVLNNIGYLDVYGTIQLIGNDGMALINTGTITLKPGSFLNSLNTDGDIGQAGTLIIEAGASHKIHEPIVDVDNGYAFGPINSEAWTRLSKGKVIQHSRTSNFDDGFQYTFDGCEGYINYQIFNKDLLSIENSVNIIIENIVLHDSSELEIDGGSVRLGNIIQNSTAAKFSISDNDNTTAILTQDITLTASNRIAKELLNTNLISGDISKIVVEIENKDDAGNITSYTYTLKTPVEIPKVVSMLTYNKKEQTCVVEGTGYTLTGHKATNAGTYTAIATLDTGYVWLDGSTKPKEIQYEISRKDPHLEVLPSQFVYDGKVHNAKEFFDYVCCAGDELTIKYESVDRVEIQEPEFKDVGDYNFWVTVSDPINYFTDIKSIHVHIAPLNVANATVELEEYDNIYVGQEIEPAIKSVTVSGLTLSSSDYTFAYSNNTFNIDDPNTKTASVTITGIGNYSGSITKEFEINRKQYSINYVLNGEEYTENVPTTYYYGKDLALPNLSKVYYVFDGWYANSNLSGDKYTIISSDNISTDVNSITYYAKLEGVEVNYGAYVNGRNITDAKYYDGENSYFETFEDALKSIKNEEGATVTLLKDAYLSSRIHNNDKNNIVYALVDTTIDLNNKTLYGPDNSSSYIVFSLSNIDVGNGITVKNGNIISRATGGGNIYSGGANTIAPKITSYNVNYSNNSNSKNTHLAEGSADVTLYGGSVDNVLILSKIYSSISPTLIINNYGNDKFTYKGNRWGDGKIEINGGLFTNNPSVYVNDEHVVIDTVGDDKTNGYNYEVVEGGKITFVNEGTLPSGYSNPTIYTKESGISLPIPTRSEYVFDGWYIDSDLTTLVTNTTSFSQGETGPKTLYAKWITVIEAAVAKIESDNQLANAVGFENGYSYYDTLANAIKDATSTETKITLLKDVAEHNLTIEANQNVTLDLNGKTIDAENLDRLFVVRGSLTIDDSTATGDETNGTYVAGRLINGRSTGNGTVGTNDSELGNAIFVKGDGATLNINDGIIEDCTMIAGKGSGNGTIYATGDNSKVRFNGGVIRNCTTLKGGAFYIAGSYFEMTGGAIINCKSTYVDGQTEGAGAINLFCNTSLITGGLISGCVAEGKCGGIQIKIAKLTITGGVFENCTGGDVTRGQLIDVINDEHNRYLLVDASTGIRGSSLEITGGTFVGAENAKTNDLIHISSNDENKITGGWYSGDITPNENYGVVGPINDAPDARAPYTVTNNIYTITYDGNGGSNIDPEKIYSLPGYSVKTRIMNDVPTKDYETFTGWNTMADGTGTRYVAGDVITLTGSITLYAQWQEQAAVVNIHSKAKISGTTISNVGQMIGGGDNIIKNKLTEIKAIDNENSVYRFDHWEIDGKEVGSSTTLQYKFTKDVTDVYAVFRYDPQIGIRVHVEAEKPFTMRVLEKQSWLFWEYYIDGEYNVNVANANGLYDKEITIVAGSSVELSYSGDDFEAWTSRLGMIQCDDPTYKMDGIYVEKDITLKLNEAKENEYYAKYMVNDTQMISSGEFTDLATLKSMAPSSGPGKIGYEFIDWTIGEIELSTITTTEQLIEVISNLEITDKVVELKPSYNKVSKSFNVTIMTLTAGSSTPTQYGDPIVVEEGNVTTLEAPEITDMKFAYWTLGSDIVSYNEKYNVKIVDEVTYVANYKSTEEEKKPTITASVTKTGTGSGIRVAFTATRDVPNNKDKYQIVENGVIYSTQSSWSSYSDTMLDSSLRFSSIDEYGNVKLKSGTKKAVNTSNSFSGNYTLTLGAFGHENNLMYLRGYVVVIIYNETNNTEETKIIYTDLYKVSYNTVTNPYIVKVSNN